VARVSSKAELAAEQSRLMGRRDHLGSPRPGNPDQLIAYARFLRNEAVKAGDFAQHEGTIASP
jgi:hypothetical protein